MNTLESIILESNRDFNYLFFDINEDTFTESTEDGDGFFDKLISRIKEIIKNIKEKFTSFFTQKTTKDAINNVQQAAKKDPKILKKQVEMIDYDKLNKLNAEIQAELSRGNGNLKEKMETYRSQRNKVIAAGAVATITLGAALAIVTTKLKSTNDKLTNKLNETERNLNRCKLKNKALRSTVNTQNEEIRDLKDKVNVLKQPSKAKKIKATTKIAKRKIVDTSNKMSDSVELLKQTANAEVEVLRNASSDVMHEALDAFKACKSADTNIIEKGKTVANSVSSVKKTLTDTANGTTKKNIISNNKDEIRSKLKSMKEKRERAEKIYKDKSQPKERRIKAKDYLDLSHDKYKTLLAKFNDLNNK